MVLVQLVGVFAFVLGVVGLIRGSVPRFRVSDRKAAAAVLAIGVLLIAVSSAGVEPEETAEPDEPTQAVESAETEESDEEPQEVDEPEEELIETKLTLDVKEIDDSLMLMGETNLPEGSEIMWDVEHLQELDFYKEGETYVEEEEFEITVDVADWPAGDVEVWVSFNPQFAGDEEAAEYEAAEDIARLTLVPPPEVYEGSGDDYLAVDPPDDPFIMLISGNQAGRHFSVVGYDADDNRTELFVNTTEYYQGITLDLQETRSLEISADGEWRVELRSLRDAQTVEVPGSIEGAGDYVFLLDGEPSAAEIEGNQQSRHFAVHGYGRSGHLLVNTTDPYEGRVRVESDVLVITVTAVGDWSIELE